MVLTWPVAGYAISRGSQGHLDEGQEAAVDIACPEGAPLLAVHDGLIYRAGWLGDCGLSLDLYWEHEGSEYVVRYCHCSELAVNHLDNVTAGQVLSYAGSTGLSTGPHLHLALWVNGVRVWPEEYLTMEEPMTAEELARLEWAETQLAKLMAIIDVDNGNITTPGNLYLVGEREDGNPIKLFMGPDLDRGLYISLDKRDPSEGTEYMAKVETFMRPPEGVPVAAGYGAIPLRLMGMLGVDELNGVTARRYVVAESLYIGSLVHRGPDGEFVHADHYDAKGVPWGDADETVMLGGAYWDQENPGVLLTAEDVLRLKSLLHT